MKKMTVLASVLLCSCVVQAEDEWVSLEKTSGEGIYQEKCGMCHADSMGMGSGILARRMSEELSLLENRVDLQAPFIENVVRSGFGVMLPMSRGEVSDPQLQSIIEYLVAED